MVIEPKYVSLSTAKFLKEKGFRLPTPHCFVHDKGEEYYFEFFSFYRGTFCAILTEIYADEKKIRKFNDHTSFISNESEIYFDYNQDIRKLIARKYNGVEWMNDEKSYNMNIDSYSFSKWSIKECENKKIELPNYNDGDFDFTVYQDIVSCPDQTQVIEWLLEVHDIFISVQLENDEKDTVKWFYVLQSLKENYARFICKNGDFNSKQEAAEAAIQHVLITKLMKNIPSKN